MNKTRIQALEYFAKKQNIDLSYSFKVDSGLVGPKIVIFGAIHGNEPVGVEAIIAIQKELDRIKKGEIIFILGNPPAYLQDVRFISSNLNRCFLNNFPKDYEGYRANEITKFLKQYKPDFLLDLHSVSLGDTKMEIYKNQKSIIKELCNPNFMQVILSKEAAKGSAIQLQFVPTMAVECGNHKSKKGLSVGLLKIKQVLDYFEMVKFYVDKTTKVGEVKIYELIAPIIPLPNFRFISENIESELFVKKNEVYATSGTKHIKAKEDCYILMPSKYPKVTDTDAGFLARKL